MLSSEFKKRSLDGKTHPLVGKASFSSQPSLAYIFLLQLYLLYPFPVLGGSLPSQAQLEVSLHLLSFLMPIHEKDAECKIKSNSTRN